jgi:hypothetical protein
VRRSHCEREEGVIGRLPAIDSAGAGQRYESRSGCRASLSPLCHGPDAGCFPTFRPGSVPSWTSL